MPVTLRLWLLWGVLAGGCSRSDPRYYGTTEPRHGPDEVWTNLGAEPEWIDPGKCTEVNGGVVILNTFAGLTQPHPVTLEPMPDVALGWELREQGRVYVFHLRSSVWSDGTPVTAHDFEYAWKRVLDRETASRYASFLYPIEYAADYNQQALVVAGFPEATPVDRLRAVIPADVPIDTVRAMDGGERMVIRVAGDEERRDEYRQKLLQALSAADLGAGRLRVSTASRDMVGVRALDDHTLEVRLETPLPYFLDIVSFYTAMPVPRHLLRELAKKGVAEALWTRPEHVVSNGPYKLVEWRFRQQMVLEKNPRYWDAASVRMARVRLRMVESYNTTLNLYEAGELDSIGTSNLPAEFKDHLARFEDFRRAPYMGVYFYWINTREKPLDDPRVRKALSLAVDRQALVSKVTRGGEIPTADLVPAGLGGYPGLQSPTFDPEAARALLETAGYGPARPLPKITLSYNTSEGHKQIAEALQAMWKTNLGVDVELANQEWKVYLKNLEMFQFQMARLGWIGDYADPNTFLELLTRDSGNNHSHWSDPRYDALLKSANRTVDRDSRFALLQQAERMAMAQVPLIPLYVYSRTEVLKPYVKGNWQNYQDRQMFKYWWIDRRYANGVPATPAEDPVPPVRKPAPVGEPAP